MKVGKKTPLTKAHFDDLFTLLPTRGDSERLDRLVRQQLAASDGRGPPLPPASLATIRRSEVTGRDDLKRSEETTKPETLLALEERWKSVLGEARENESKAQAMEDAVYDLKAVNPNKTDVSDKRTPTQLLDVIEEKGREADAALTRLRMLIEDSSKD